MDNKPQFKIADLPESTRQKHHLVYRYKDSWLTVCEIQIHQQPIILSEYKGFPYPALCKNCTNEVEMQKVLKNLIKE